MIELTLPFPPSVNHYWRHVRGKPIVSKDGRLYRDAVFALVAYRVMRLEGQLAVEVTLHPPDKKRRDIDNSCKALLDAMQHAGVYHDDHQICELIIRRSSVVPGGKAIVRVENKYLD